MRQNRDLLFQIVFSFTSNLYWIQQTGTKTYQAAVFHMGAHLRYGKKSFEVGQLKPMQVAIISIIEDARVEMLAGLELPGLNRLWTEFHDAPSSGINTAQRMFERLSRALIDPNFHTDDGWAEKGKRMFYQARDSWDDQVSGNWKHLG